MKIKKWGKAIIASLFLLLITSCTANFCSNKDRACKWFATYGLKENRDQLILEAKESTDIPHDEFWESFDTKTIEVAQKEEMARSNKNELEGKDLLVTYGYALYLDDNYSISNSNKRELWKNFDLIVEEVTEEVGIFKAPTTDFINFYKNKLKSLTANYRTCISPTNGTSEGVGKPSNVEAKSWGYAWGKGIIEGLLVYPISWGVHQLSVAFGANGIGQLLAIVVITIIVRGLMMLVTFKSTLAQGKMTALQPELAKLQAKYPNSNTNQYEKQQLAQAQMALYKKHKINPFSQLLILIVQFPVFIAVWSALQGAAILSNGSFLGLELSASLGGRMINFSSTACITAWVLFILMSVSQFISMKLPQWMQKKANKSVTKMGKNPAMDKAQSQTKMISNIMLIMIIVMGFSLPAAMGVYWLIGAIISIVQTVITQKIMRKKK